MNNRLFLLVILSLLSFAVYSQKVPSVDELKQISQLPSEIPQRVTAMAYDGEKFWLAIYLDRGRYVTYNPATENWNFEQNTKIRSVIPKITGKFASASSMVFVDEKLWLGSSYGESFGWLNTNDTTNFKVFEKVYKPDLSGSQSYADMTFDGNYIWAAWHSYNWKMDKSKTQLLLKIEKDTGEVVSEYPLPKGSSDDGTHGLAFDGEKIWHIKANKLSAINLEGKMTEQFILNELKRPSGMVWKDDSLWIVEFNGKIWKLPFKEN